MSSLKEEKYLNTIISRINHELHEEVEKKYAKIFDRKNLTQSFKNDYISKNWTVLDGYSNFTFFINKFHKDVAIKNCLNASFSYYLKSKIDPNIVLYFCNAQQTVDNEAYRKFENNKLVKNVDKTFIIYANTKYGYHYNEFFPLPKENCYLNDAQVHCMILDQNTKTWHSVIPAIKHDKPAWYISEISLWNLYKYWETEVLPKFKSWKKSKFDKSILNASKYYLNKYIIDRLLTNTPAIFRMYNNSF